MARLSPEKIQDLKDSDGWKAVAGYVQDRIDHFHHLMENPDLEAKEFRRSQGAVRELRRFQKLEEILK